MLRWTVFLLFYKWEHWISVRLINMPNGTQLVNGRGKKWTQVHLLLKPTLFPSCFAAFTNWQRLPGTHLHHNQIYSAVCWGISWTNRCGLVRWIFTAGDSTATTGEDCWPWVPWAARGDRGYVSLTFFPMVSTYWMLAEILSQIFNSLPMRYLYGS